MAAYWSCPSGLVTWAMMSRRSAAFSSSSVMSPTPLPWFRVSASSLSGPFNISDLGVPQVEVLPEQASEIACHLHLVGESGDVVSGPLESVELFFGYPPSLLHL